MFHYGFSATVGLEVLAKKDGSLLPTYIHRYNVATTNSSRTSYDGNVSDWYTDRYQNLMGLPLKLCYKTSRDNKFDKLLDLQFDVFREKMNVTYTIAPASERLCTMTYQSYYLFHNKLYENSRDHTVPIYIDKFCLFTPTIMQKGTVLISWGISIAFLVGIVIVVFILGFSIDPHQNW